MERYWYANVKKIILNKQNIFTGEILNDQSKLFEEILFFYKECFLYYPD